MPALLLTRGRQTDCHFSIIYTFTLLCGLLVWLDYTFFKLLRAYHEIPSKQMPQNDVHINNVCLFEVCVCVLA